MPTFAGSKVAHTRSRLGVAARRGNSDEITDAKRDHAAARIEQFVEKTVAAAPPLSPDQTDRIVTILRGGVR